MPTTYAAARRGNCRTNDSVDSPSPSCHGNARAGQEAPLAGGRLWVSPELPRNSRLDTHGYGHPRNLVPCAAMPRRPFHGNLATRNLANVPNGNQAAAKRRATSRVPCFHDPVGRGAPRQSPFSRGEACLAPCRVSCFRSRKHERRAPVTLTAAEGFRRAFVEVSPLRLTPRGHCERGRGISPCAACLPARPASLRPQPLHLRCEFAPTGNPRFSRISA